MDDPLTRWELWKHESAEGITYSFFPEDNETARSLIEPGSVLMGEVLATTHVEALTWRNEFLGWKPYKPWT